MPEVSLPWGDGELKIALPEHWQVQQIAASSLPRQGGDWRDALGAALGQPTGEAPLGQLLAARRTGRIVLVVEDFSRHSPLAEILEVVMAELTRQRISTNQVQVIFATGMHPQMTAAQAAAKLGPLAHSLRWRSNRCKDAAGHVHLGRVGKLDASVDRDVADADLRIVISSVSPHLQAGFGGGYKMFLPGCASIETIRQLHRMGVDRVPRQWVGTDAAGNPMRAAIDAAGRLIDQRHGKSFAVQYVLDNDDRPAIVAAGSMEAVQQMLAKRCAVACGVLVEKPADVLLVNAYPRDCDLWQSFKGIANTRWAARAGGVIICLARCEAGMYGMDVPQWSLSWKLVRALVRLLGSDALGALLTRLAPNLAADAAFFIRLALQAIHRNPVLMVSPALAGGGKTFPGLKIVADPADAIAEAGKLLGDSPQKVTVFPSGGTTYPVIAGGSTGGDRGGND